jgi:hypothetical protein
MSDFVEMREDDGQRVHEETMREPEWVRDMLNTPWVTEVGKGGSISIIDKDGNPVAVLSARHPEMMAVTASVICDHVNRI